MNVFDQPKNEAKTDRVYCILCYRIEWRKNRFLIKFTFKYWYWIVGQIMIHWNTTEFVKLSKISTECWFNLLFFVGFPLPHIFICCALWKSKKKRLTVTVNKSTFGIQHTQWPLCNESLDCVWDEINYSTNPMKKSIYFWSLLLTRWIQKKSKKEMLQWKKNTTKKSPTSRKTLKNVHFLILSYACFSRANCFFFIKCQWLFKCFCINERSKNQIHRIYALNIFLFIMIPFYLREPATKEIESRVTNNNCIDCVLWMSIRYSQLYHLKESAIFVIRYWLDNGYVVSLFQHNEKEKIFCDHKKITILLLFLLGNSSTSALQYQLSTLIKIWIYIESD